MFATAEASLALSFALSFESRVPDIDMAESRALHVSRSLSHELLDLRVRSRRSKSEGGAGLHADDLSQDISSCRGGPIGRGSTRAW